MNKTPPYLVMQEPVKQVVESNNNFYNFEVISETETPRTQEMILMSKKESFSPHLLKEKFRKTIWSIIDRMRRLKLTYKEVIFQLFYWEGEEAISRK